MSENLKETLKTIHTTLVPPIHASGWPIIVGCVFIALILSLIWDVLGFIGFIVSAWLFCFFRAPKRYTPDREGLVIAPISGRITEVTPNTDLPKEFDQTDESQYTKVTILPSPFNAHIIRFPIAATITQSSESISAAMHSGFDKADEESDHCAVLFDAPYKSKTYDMAFMVTAKGPLSKIICEASEKKKYVTGEICGHLRFHGFIDLYIPKNTALLCDIGQSMTEGETVIADFASKEKHRPAVER
jgi:phosphatidylserine decarboxylase